MRLGNPRSRLHVFSAVLATIGVTLGLLATGVAPATAQVVSAAPSASASVSSGVSNASVVKAADLSKFDPANIISDAVFYDSGAMTSAQIQAFLDQKIGACQNGRCLNVTTTNISSRDARYSGSTGALICNAIQGGAMKVSELIYRLQVACGISAKVILVTLQKEQGLTTSRAPSDWNLNAAMGQACPDTAPCDPAFKGIGPQLVGGVTQLKTYKAAEFGKRPGNNYIQWNPNAACGGTNLNIQNWATASLYTYTPYQPNAAALRAGYGLGDGCSSYGNRNFYQYYVDWFGSTQGASNPIVKVGRDIYILSGSRRYHITSDVWPAYGAAFGGASVVSASYLAGFAPAGDATRVVRNSSTGVIAYVADGATHRFASCELVATWGESCENRVELEAHDFERARVGGEMSSFAKLTGDARRFLVENGILYPVASLATMTKINGTSPYVAEMPASVARGYEQSARLVYEPGKFVKVGGESVYLPTVDGKLVHLPSWTLAKEMGLPTGATWSISENSAKAYQKAGRMHQFVTCAGIPYFGGSGRLYRLAGGLPQGFEASVLSAASCAGFDRTGAQVDGPLFVRAAGGSTVYHAIGGEYREVASQTQLRSLNGGQSPAVVPVSATILATLPIGAPYLPSGTPVRAADQAAVWVVDGDGLMGLPSWDLAAEMGLPTAPKIVAPSVLQGRTTGVALTSFVQCGESVLVAAGGRLSPVASADLAGGNPITRIGADLCGALTLDGRTITTNVFITDGARTAVATDGGYRWLIDGAAVLRANGGAAPTVLTVGAKYARSLPLAGGEPVPGDVVRSSADSAVTLVDGATRQWVANLGVLADLGIGSRSRVLAPATLANIAPTEARLNVLVTCGGVSYVAAQGVLHRLDGTALAGLPTSALSAAACATLNLGGAPITGRLFVRAAGTTQVYVAQSGALRALAPGETPAGVAGVASPIVLDLDARTLAGLPKR
jgi:hypothetical protein